MQRCGSGTSSRPSHSPAYTHTPARLTGALSTYRAPPVFFTTGRSQLSSRSPHTRERRELLAQLLHLGRYQVLHEAAAWQRVVSAGMTLSASPAITSDNNRLFWLRKKRLGYHPTQGGVGSGSARLVSLGVRDVVMLGEL